MTNRETLIARCKASGMDDEEAADFADEMLAEAEARAREIETEAHAIYQRVTAAAGGSQSLDFFPAKRISAS